MQKQRSLTETLRIAQDKLLRQAANDDGKRDDDDFKFESRSMDPNPIEIRIRSREDKFCSMDPGNGTLAITRFNHLYVFGETICINHLQKHDKEAQFTGYGRILENEKLQLINWKRLVKEYKLNHGFIHNMNEIYEGSEMDSFDEGESDIRLLNSVLIENGIVLVTATKKKNFDMVIKVVVMVMILVLEKEMKFFHEILYVRVCVCVCICVCEQFIGVYMYIYK